MNNINNLLNNRKKIEKKISSGIDRELERQKNSGKKFLTDEEIDNLIEGILQEESNNFFNIEEVNKPKLRDIIYLKLEKELKRQNKVGIKFLSDEEIDNLVDNILKKEMGDSWLDDYTNI